MRYILLALLIVLSLSVGYLVHCVFDELKEEFEPESHAHGGMI